MRVKDLSSDTLVIWPRELSPNYYDLVVKTFRRDGFAGPVTEMENLSHAVFFGDTAARIEVAACRAFSVGFATEWSPLSGGFVWRPVTPTPTIPLDMFWKLGSGAVVETFVGLAREVAQTEGWLVAPCLPEDPRRQKAVHEPVGV